MPTKIEVATRGLRKMMKDRGEHFIRSQPSGGLQCALWRYLKDEPVDVGYITEATINTARRRVLASIKPLCHKAVDGGEGCTDYFDGQCFRDGGVC